MSSSESCNLEVILPVFLCLIKNYANGAAEHLKGNVIYCNCMRIFFKSDQKLKRGACFLRISMSGPREVIRGIATTTLKGPGIQGGLGLEISTNRAPN